MGRPRTLDTYVHDPSNPVFRAKQAKREAREAFEAEQARLWTARAGGYDRALFQALLDAKRAGTSVAELCRMYGTTSRNTILDLLARAQESLGGEPTAQHTVTHATPEGLFSVVLEPYTREDGQQFTAVRVTTYKGWKSLTGEPYAGTLRLYFHDLAVLGGTATRTMKKFITEDPSFDPGSPLQAEILSADLRSPVVQALQAHEDVR